MPTAKETSASSTKKEETRKFSLEIERVRKEKNVSYLEAIVLYCETHDFDIETASKILSPLIKTQLRIEAEDLHFLPRPKNRRLPL